jgi:hypothetical protein
MSGEQWGAWNAAYGPRGPDGRPAPLWDPKNGKINRELVQHWKKYDLRLVLEQKYQVVRGDVTQGSSNQSIDARIDGDVLRAAQGPELRLELVLREGNLRVESAAGPFGALRGAVFAPATGGVCS